MNRCATLLLCLATVSFQATAAELAGRLNGADWKALAALKGQFQFKDSETSYSICAEVLDPKLPFGKQPQVMVSIPKRAKVGDALMGKGRTITIFVPPGTNTAFDDGSATITAVTATSRTVSFDARFDKDNWIKGEFTIPIGE